MIKGAVIPKVTPTTKPDIISNESCAFKYNLALDTNPVIIITEFSVNS